MCCTYRYVHKSGGKTYMEVVGMAWRCWRERKGFGTRGPTNRVPEARDREKEIFWTPVYLFRRARCNFGYSQYCQLPVATTYAARSAFVTAWAQMQSARRLVRTIHQL
jgi:hypothetical protein